MNKNSAASLIGPASGSRVVLSRTFLAEELANSITHGVGILFSCAALVLLLLNVPEKSGTYFVSPSAAWIGFLIFGVSLLFLYIMSTVYHALPDGRVRTIFQQLDHTAIFVLIAGSYSAFCLSAFYSTFGLWMCIAVWGMALVGISAEILWGRRAHRFSLLLYLIMGWFVVSKFSIVAAALPALNFRFLLAGGILYTVGVIFYVLQKLPWMHPIWHLFVLGGCVCHVLALLFL